MVARAVVAIVIVAMAPFGVLHPIGSPLHSSWGFPRRTAPGEHIRLVVRVAGEMGWTVQVADVPSLEDQPAGVYRTVLYRRRVNSQIIKLLAS